MEASEMQGYLNTFFESYTFSPEFIIVESQPDDFTYGIINVNLFQLNSEILIQYTNGSLVNYLIEILAYILKDKCNLDSIVVKIHEQSYYSNPTRINLGDYSRLLSKL